MASKTPMVRQFAWISIIPHLLFMGIFLFIFTLIVKPFYFALCLAAVTYLIISFSLRFGLLRNQRKGIRLLKKENYQLAIEEFQKSYDFFTKHAWLDKYRYLTLFDSSRISYTEIALNNIAFCCLQTGEATLAKQYYEKTLEQFPNSGMAKTALNMFNTIESQFTK